MLIKIKHRYTKNVLYSCDAENLRDAVENAIKAGANLAGANLTDANLTGANLTGAYLTGANMAGANIAGEKLAICPITIYGLYWNVLISEGFMKIGCQRHTHDAWKNFTISDIGNMHDQALEFWGANKTVLLKLCANHRKESLSYCKDNPEKFLEK